MPLLGLALAALVGIALGLLGGGGSILTIPILVYVLDFPARDAIALGLGVVGVASVVGAVGHWRSGNVQLRAALTFGSVGMIGTFAGTRLAAFLTGAMQLVVFAVAMLAAAIFMFRGGAKVDGAGRRAAPLPTALAALGVGLMTGVAGVGGGFLIVPALVLFVGLPMRQAVGTSLVVIALNSFVGFAGYLGAVEVPWLQLGIFTALAVAGIVVGTAASRHVPQGALKRAFAAFLVAMSAFILFENRSAFAADPDEPATAAHDRRS